MRNISFMLMADTYKNTNPDALPKGLTKLTSYITPRKSMFKNLKLYSLDYRVLLRNI